jgi:methyl-accepting chemotaxis protein
MPDQFNMSGDFRGAIVNIKSTLTNVQQSIGAISTEDKTTRYELEKLISQLSEALENVPAAMQEQAQAIAETTKALVDVAKSETPNKTMLQITGDGLKKAAQSVAGVLPSVIPIVGQIVMAVTKLAGH